MAHRTFNPAQRPASKRSARCRHRYGVRPLTKLRTIEETAEIFNTSTRTVRRLIELGCTASAPPRTLRSHFGSDIAVFLAANRSV